MLKENRGMKWCYISALLCTYGFFKEFRPSESFISPYLTTFKNFTIKEVNEEIFPVGTYCYLCLLILIFLLTDFLRYKPVLLFGSVSGVITWGLLILGTTIKAMQTVEFFYGFFLASEVAYFTYIYAAVNKKYYQKVTSHTRAAILLGKAIAGLSSQLLVSLKINYLELNYFTVFGVGITVPLALFLPSVPQSIYFHPRKTETVSAECEIDCSSSRDTKWNEKTKELTNKGSNTRQCRTAFLRLYEDFRQAFANVYVLKWSAWWALATCGYLQAISYCQLLWEDIIQENHSTLYHGYVEFAYAISGVWYYFIVLQLFLSFHPIKSHRYGAAAAFGVGYLKVQWNTWGEVFLGLLTVIQGGFLFYSAYLNNLYVAYGIFILYRDFYEVGITIATYEVAKFINEDSHALVFGINTFTALIVQTILTTVVLEILQVNIRPQYQIYGGYHFAIGFAFLVYGVFRLIFFNRKNLL